MKRTVMFIFAWVVTILGFVGIVVPVLPTTPFLLLATYLFTRSSPKAEAWLKSTDAYKRYVLPFKCGGGIPILTKVRILAISFIVMGISAWVAKSTVVYIILSLVSLFLLYLMFIRIPTISEDEYSKSFACEETEEEEF